MKANTIAILASAVIIAAAILFSSSGGTSQTGGAGGGAAAADQNNVTVQGGRQIIEVSAGGGYRPQRSVAKAGIPTVLRFKTSGSFDCSSSIRIQSLGITKVLPPSGTTDIDLGTPTPTTLRGTCAMGMYSFQIEFHS